MGTRQERESATIYRFPTGGRAAAAPRTPASAGRLTPRSGSGWYHEQAIREAGDDKTPPPRH